ncbi:MULTISPECIES: hypothetical protein [Streptomyces]|uniref:hypothetical protein n=1 Tax=Streptomyces TaxID=1883 RepID=UPI00073DCC44|nr:hypothetical protein [Streptomyces sp. FBKL.4005]MYU28613.1 hypothetical protein [Streptomyces sp. SID7810]OYP17013.1 hypothetical protein CFC35_22970 [Streptomyces sp. FBKL.4005]CUW29651.1 hypothetical protein TUE45_04360 [Streptomyces reticuli]
MNGPATTAQWLACGGIGTGASALFLALLKVALDEGPLPEARAAWLPPRPSAPPLPARAPQRSPRHAAPLTLVRPQPLPRVRPRARHSKEAA